MLFSGTVTYIRHQSPLFVVDAFSIAVVVMSIEDVYVWKDNDRYKSQHHFLLPNSLRALVVGKSGCGKSTLVDNLLLQPELLDYDNLLVFGPSLHQAEYEIMKAAFAKHLSKKQIRVLFKQQEDVHRHGGIQKVLHDYKGPCKGTITADFQAPDGTSGGGIPDPSDLSPQQKNLILFDDIMTGPQSKAEDYYTRGRDNNTSCIHIAQNYFKLPRQTIRENSNFLVLFKQDDKNLQHIYQDRCAEDEEILPYDLFKAFCHAVWNDHMYNFVVIDNTRPSRVGKYRKNLNYWCPLYMKDVRDIESIGQGIREYKHLSTLSHLKHKNHQQHANGDH